MVYVAPSVALFLADYFLLAIVLRPTYIDEDVLTMCVTCWHIRKIHMYSMHDNLSSCLVVRRLFLGQLRIFHKILPL